MADLYVNLTYDDYKALEDQCRAFAETVHGEGTEYYHKSFAVHFAGLRLEFHGPNVKARYEETPPNIQCGIYETPHENSRRCVLASAHSGKHIWGEL